jgi:hypothetical protein
MRAHSSTDSQSTEALGKPAQNRLATKFLASLSSRAEQIQYSQVSVRKGGLPPLILWWLVGSPGVSGGKPPFLTETHVS